MHLRPTRFHIVFATGLLLSLFAAGFCRAASVTIDPAAKKGTSDDPSVEVRGVQVKGEQVGFMIQNTTAVPQTAKVSVPSIAEGDYDLYINSSYIGAKTSKEIVGGFELSMPGSVADPDILRCLQALKPKVDAEHERIDKIKSPEPMRVAHTLGQAADWVRFGMNAEKNHRALIVLLSPSAKMLQAMSWPTVQDAETTAKALTRAVWLLQQARDRMFDVIKEPDLRNQAVVAMTPVDLKVVSFSKNSRPCIEATVVNNCNLPVSGKFSVSVPKGWKTNAKSLAIPSIKPGKTHVLVFGLIPTAKGVPAPGRVVVAANLRVVEDPFVAEFKLIEVAKGKSPGG